MKHAWPFGQNEATYREAKAFIASVIPPLPATEREAARAIRVHDRIRKARKRQTRPFPWRVPRGYAKVGAEFWVWIAQEWPEVRLAEGFPYVVPGCLSAHASFTFTDSAVGVAIPVDAQARADALLRAGTENAELRERVRELEGRLASRADEHERHVKEGRRGARERWKSGSRRHRP